MAGGVRVAGMTVCVKVGAGVEEISSGETTQPVIPNKNRIEQTANPEIFFMNDVQNIFYSEAS